MYVPPGHENLTLRVIDSDSATMSVPWPIRSVLAGTAGTAAMTLSYATEHQLRHKVGPLDYDDSLVPGEIVAGIMHLGNVSNREANDLGLALRWSYGSAFGIWHGTLRRKLPEPWASLAFGATLMTATLSLFPILGRTPPPWRWPPAVIATAFGTHAAYVTAVALVDDRLAGGARAEQDGGGHGPAMAAADSNGGTATA